DWFMTSGPNRAPDVRAREVGGFRQVSQGEQLERMALEKKNRPPAKARSSEKPTSPLLPGAESW
ncbi:unnamed protein product, partial [marine sediment metagenome]